jgi:hypothetical protein
MGHYISVLICVIDPSETPSRLFSWEDAADVIDDRLNKWVQEGNTKGFLQSTSKNWWHQHLLHLICQAYDIAGLEFTAQEIACLRKQDLLAGDVGLSKLFQIIETQRLQDKLDMFGDYSDVLDQGYLAAFHEAKIVADVEEYDGGFRAAVSFFSFLKSLKATTVEAYQANSFLLYIMPAFNDLGGHFDT